MAEPEKDPVLEAQARTKEAINRTLAKHGWKLGRVSMRRGAIVVYNLERLDGSKTIEHTVLLSDILMWGLGPPSQTGHDVGELMLGLSLLRRVKAENAADGIPETA